MAYVFIEGFDYYGVPSDILLGSALSVANGSLQDVALVNGFYQHGKALSLKNSSFNPPLSVTFGTFSSLSEFFFACDVLLEVLPTSATAFINFLEGITNQVNLLINTNGTIQARRDVNPIGSASTFAFSTNVRYRLEVRCVINDTTGIVEVRVDGTTVINLTNVDTRNGTPTGVDRFFLSSLRRSDNFGSTIFDNVTVNDTTGNSPTSFPGQRRVETIFPDSDASVQWTPSQGALNYDLVNDAELNAARYVQSNTVGHIDRYGFSNLSGNPSGIDAVQLVYHAMRTDPGSRTVRGFLRSGSAQTNGSSETPTVAPTGRYYRVTAHVDPNTSSAWTTTSVNAIQGGVEVLT